MIEFLKAAALMMSFAVTILLSAGFIPSVMKRKAFHFVCGEMAFVTAIAYACLTVVEPRPVTSFGLGAWFLVGSIKFAHTTFVATK